MQDCEVTMVTRDDLGVEARLARPARRVVSLVPSLTEAIAVTDRPALVGVTEWCTHPVDLDVRRVRGTKNPDVAAIVGLEPDLVVANKEENRELDVRRLRAKGIPVWVTVTETVRGAIGSMRRLFAGGLGWAVPDWLEQVDEAWPERVPTPTHRVAIPIWRDPWMVVGRETFTGDLAAHLGLANVFADDAERYPHVAVADIVAREPDVVVLPDEPYVFTAIDGPEAFPGLPCALVEGRALTWYGPSLLTARDTVLTAVRG
jgi:ABC-type Fe3+-hydroxamate transport system substrate-binding protein